MPPRTVIPEELEAMSHLRTDALKEEVQKSVEPPKPPIPENDPKLQKEYTFQFKWADGRGKSWEGEFTNHILTIRERGMVGVFRARLGGGQPFDSLDPLTQEINLIIAHLSFSLSERPDWAKDLREVQDVKLLQSLYTEVIGHEATFFGW